MLSRRLLGLASLLPLVLACSKSAPPAEEPRYELDDEEESSGGPEMMAEFGGLNEEKVARVFKNVQPALSDCLMKGYSRVEFLGGEVRFLVNVNLSGRAESAFIESSNLGDYETERCMLRELASQKWPKPVGGRIGPARNSIAFDPPSDVRAPVDWSTSDVRTALAQGSDDLRACGGNGPFVITAYVNTNGSVMSAGVAHSDPNGEAAAECLLNAVRSLRFPSPGSWPAKVTFER